MRDMSASYSVQNDIIDIDNWFHINFREMTCKYWGLHICKGMGEIKKSQIKVLKLSSNIVKAKMMFFI